MPYLSSKRARPHLVAKSSSFHSSLYEQVSQAIGPLAAEECAESEASNDREQAAKFLRATRYRIRRRQIGTLVHHIGGASLNVARARQREKDDQRHEGHDELQNTERRNAGTMSETEYTILQCPRALMSCKRQNTKMCGGGFQRDAPFVALGDVHDHGRDTKGGKRGEPEKVRRRFDTTTRR